MGPMCSFGGRLLGALACDRVERYIGTDPSTYAMDGLREMAAELVPMAEEFGRRTLEVDLHQAGSAGAQFARYLFHVTAFRAGE